MAFVVRSRSKDGGYLLGGEKTASGWKRDSSRWGRRDDAENYRETVAELRTNETAEIVEVKGYPEIFPHCGDIATAIGCKCPSCGEVLTVKHAKRYGKG